MLTPEADPEDVRQILVQLRKTRASLLTRLAGVPKSERSTANQRDLDECNEEIRKYEALLESQPISFRFINREREFTRLTLPTAAKYIAIEAPAGYGKSALLQRMHEYFNSRQDTLSLIADLTLNNDNTPRIRFAAPKDFIAYEGLLGAEDAVESLIRHAVTPGILEFILLIDDMQLLVKDSIATNALWRDLIEVLDRRLAGVVNFRVIFAGRRVRAPWQGVLRNGLQAMELEPFSERAVSEAVETFLFANYDRRMQQFSLGLLSFNIYDLTGGHPLAIFQIIRELAEVGFALDYSVESERYVFRATEKLRLSQTYCVPALDDVFSGVPPDVRAAMQVLSVVRGFNANIISHFITAGLHIDHQRAGSRHQPQPAAGHP